MHHQPNVIRELALNCLNWNYPILDTCSLTMLWLNVWLSHTNYYKNMITTSLCLQKLVNVWWFLNFVYPPRAPHTFHDQWQLDMLNVYIELGVMNTKISSTLLSFWKLLFFFPNHHNYSTQFYLNRFQIVLLLLKLKTNIITRPVWIKGLKT